MSARVVALDLGSNSFHLALFSLQGGACAQIERHKVAVGLGLSVFSCGTVDRVRYEAGIAAVRRLSGVARAMRSDAVLAVATSALRDADNGAAFLHQAERIAGFPIRIIDGVEEARLVGMSASASLPGRRSITFDLGGGSMEIAVSHEQRCVFARSLAIGTLRSRATWPTARADEAALRMLRAQVGRELDAPLGQAVQYGFDHASLSCGAARDLLRLVQRWLPSHARARGSDERWLRRDDLLALTPRLRALAGTPEGERAGISKARSVESLLVASVVFEELLARLALSGMHVSRASIRHGLALDYLQRTRASAPTALAV